MTIDKHKEAMEIVNQYISPPYGMIIDEVNSYSVEFSAIMDLRNNQDIVCIGIVYYRVNTIIALSFAKRFIGKPSRFSSDINEIKDWVIDNVVK